MLCKISWLTQHPHQTDQLPSPQVRLVCLKVLTVKRKFHFPYSPPRKNEIDQSQLGVAALKKNPLLLPAFQNKAMHIFHRDCK